MVLRIVTFSLIIGATFAATFRGKLPQKPEELAHKEGCYVKEINDVIPFYEEISPIGTCHRIECGRHSLEYASCVTVNTDDPKCHITDFDLSRPYPDCCPDVKCDIENSLV